MNINISLGKKKSFKKKVRSELNPRRYWVWLLSIGVLFLAGELVYFSYVFWKATKNLDAPATPILETNAPGIRSMEATLNVVEKAVTERTGVPIQ
jgi:hypothetical protein